MAEVGILYWGPELHRGLIRVTKPYDIFMTLQKQNKWFLFLTHEKRLEERSSMLKVRMGPRVCIYLLNLSYIPPIHV